MSVAKLVNKTKNICNLCKKEIAKDGMKCPLTKEKFHTKCIAKHLQKCKAPHIRLRMWSKGDTGSEAESVEA